MSRPITDSYGVSPSIGTFADEVSFKRQLIEDLKSTGFYSTVLMIENREEPGMPDLLLIDSDQCATFAEIKYSTGSKIEFERSQIPWYMRHTRLNIIVIVYNSKTKNIHTMNAAYVRSVAESTKISLRDEQEFL